MALNIYITKMKKQKWIKHPIKRIEIRLHGTPKKEKKEDINLKIWNKWVRKKCGVNPNVNSLGKNVK